MFTFNAVILCQYIGCCNVPGDPKVFAGKVDAAAETKRIGGLDCSQKVGRYGTRSASLTALVVSNVPVVLQIVSTVIGSTISLLLGWLVLPWYASTRMLQDQAEALRAALGLQRRMHGEVAAAAAAGRAVCTDGWLEAIETDVQVGKFEF